MVAVVFAICLSIYAVCFWLALGELETTATPPTRPAATGHKN